MYDFSKQKQMLNLSLALLKENHLLEVSALGGGTALSAYYWGHRYSTDIDMFVHQREDVALLFRPKLWSADFLSALESIGYSGNYKGNPAYAEITIEQDFKIQYFSVKDRAENAYTKVTLWDMEIQIESIEEIIAKKIYYRCHKGNARDLFDIALAIHKDPAVLNKLLVPFKSIEALFDTVSLIDNDTQLKEAYLFEIKQMRPNPQYENIALTTIAYLKLFLESYCAAHNMGIALSLEECQEIEMFVKSQLESND